MPRTFCQYCGGENKFSSASSNPKFCSDCGVDLKTGKKPTPPTPQKRQDIASQKQHFKDQLAELNQNYDRSDDSDDHDGHNLQPLRPEKVNIQSNLQNRPTIGDVDQGTPRKIDTGRPVEITSKKELRQFAQQFGSSRKSSKEVG